MDLEPANRRRLLFLRIGGSVLVFAVFVILAVSWVLTQDSTLKWAMFIPLVASVVLLPRELGELDTTEEFRSRTKLWLSYVRVVYFLLAAFVMLGLPELLF